MKGIFIIIIQVCVISAENLITFSEFHRAVTDNVYPAPTREQYNTIINMAKSAGNITTKEELAMFLAQVLWESAGLQAKKEIKCATNSCPSSYRTGREKPGKYYYGRGYIQLTWLYNYEQCSQELYGDDRLVEDPDLVSDTEEGAWGSAFWYWARHCHNAVGVSEGMFGSSTMAINGALECKGPYKVKAFKRFTIYVKVLKAFKLKDVKPLQDGCYPMSGEDATDFRLCDAVGAHQKSVGMFHWCNDNCNAEDPNCPPDMCECEGGNPVKKVAQNESSTHVFTQNQPKIETKQYIEPKIPYKVSPKIQAKPVLKEEKAIRETERNLYFDAFRYQEPKRSSTEKPDLSASSSTTNKPDLSRTRLLRNELGRLIRKRPIVRTESPLISQ